MAAAYPKSPELQAFEDWARDKTWFKKTKGHFGRNGNDTCYTHYTVNDRANAFLAGVKHAKLEQVCGLIKSWPDLYDDHLTQPAQAVDVPDEMDPFKGQPEGLNYADGWNACREAMLTAALPNGKEG